MSQPDYKNTEGYKKGIAYFMSKYDPKHIEILDKLYEFSPALADVVVSFGLNDIWKNKTPLLTDKEKEIAVFATLITSCTVPKEIKAHTICLLNVGMTKDQIKELLVLMTLYIGVPNVITASTLVAEAFVEYDALHK
ncbi:MAG TPA: carboxymuconolactone decarboxylase family protein [Gammaproteobacteria bacterium]|nr:carboxymuconolactone decarboxylase family protein [Gammaproteobacteria bacterium]